MFKSFRKLKLSGKKLAAYINFIMTRVTHFVVQLSSSFVVIDEKFEPIHFLEATFVSHGVYKDKGVSPANICLQLMN